MAKKRDFFDLEQERIQLEMSKYDVCSDEYRKLMAEQKELISLRGESRESKRRISKSDKGQLLIRGLTIGSGLLAILGIAHFESEGNTFTGEKRSLIDTIGGCVGRFLFK